jgi:ADP-ribose pyrophosphatase
MIAAKCRIGRANLRAGRSPLNSSTVRGGGIYPPYGDSPQRTPNHKALYAMADDERTLLKSRRFSVVEKTVTRADGRTASVEFVKHHGSVAILPILSDGRVCLIHSRRLTVDETLIEVPAGTREPNETPLETASRELAEETGYRAGHFEELIAYYPSPGILSERMWIFVAQDLTEGDPAREANEEIENLVVSWDDALAMIDRGDIHDGKTIAAILLWERKQRQV